MPSAPWRGLAEMLGHLEDTFEYLRWREADEDGDGDVDEDITLDLLPGLLHVVDELLDRVAATEGTARAEVLHAVIPPVQTRVDRSVALGVSYTAGMTSAGTR